MTNIIDARHIFLKRRKKIQDTIMSNICNAIREQREKRRERVAKVDRHEGTVFTNNGRRCSNVSWFKYIDDITAVECPPHYADLVQYRIPGEVELQIMEIEE